MNEPKRVADVLKRLLGRRDPSLEVLFQVEMLQEEGVAAIARLLEEPALAPRKQLRALQGLAHAAKHLGPNTKARVAEIAITLCSAGDIAVRSRAAHMAIVSLALLRSLGGSDAERHRRELRPRIIAAVREASAIGLTQPTDRMVPEFLAREG